MKAMYSLERVGFAAAIVIAIAYGSAEAWAVVSGSCQDRPIPWGLLIIELTLAVPFVLGRATAGKIWEALVARLPGKRGDDRDG